MAEQTDGGRELDLEKELSCSICTDVLYRPLTLLDCLHTFCGSCLKEWFTWQSTSTATRHEYTCPACRAVVRDTRPNATLTTLLEMFLNAHPERGKTAQDKLDMDKIYTPGDNVIPPVDLGSVSDLEGDDDSEDERMLEQVRALSLDQVGLSTATSHVHSHSHTHSHSRGQSRQRPGSGQQRDTSRHQQNERQSEVLSHQSSLRSLLSASDLDSADMEEEIMQHIIDQGLLDGIDLNNLTPAQEDQITDSIARAFRSRRQRERSERRNRPRHRHSPSTSSNSHVQLAPPTNLAPVQPLSHRRRATSANHDSVSHNHLRVLDSRSRPSNHSTPALPTSQDQDLPEAVANPAPFVACSRCQKPDIQHSLHYNCPKCSNGDFNLCLTCYRGAKGCLNWYGFGHAALARYQRPVPPDSESSPHEPPHVLIARRYQQDTNRLDQGLFCEGCFAFSNACYWHCDSCNEGAWGFCNACVQQGKHCVHPLASVAHVSLLPSSQQPNRSAPGGNHNIYPQPLSSSKSAFHFAVPSVATLPHVSDPSLYASISLASYCDVCHYSILPSHARFHCNTCNEGNYDICTSCYHTLINTGKISQENGPSGWRRCLRAHRMSVVGHEDREGGPHRIVVKEMVGGWALKEEATTSQTPAVEQWRWKESDGTSASQPSSRTLLPNMLPPDGGVGLRAQAMWSYFPGEQVRDELAFPRNAIITEAENINGDWYWGVYAGKKGLFPGNYARII